MDWIWVGNLRYLLAGSRRSTGMRGTGSEDVHH
jgi:hypothetical protein